MTGNVMNGQLRMVLFGVGGAGGNIATHLVRDPAPGLRLILANTDAQALHEARRGERLQLGRVTTCGLGAGGRPEIGEAAARETLDAIEAALEGAQCCGIFVGLGGGTGTGAAPLIARVARARGILVFGYATMPFRFEGRRRAATARAGLAALEAEVDALILVDNERLLVANSAARAMREALAAHDSKAARLAADLAGVFIDGGAKQLSFGDLAPVLRGGGRCTVGVGESARVGMRAIEAVERAIDDPLLDRSIMGARRALVTFTADASLTLIEVEEALQALRAVLDSDAEIAWGVRLDPLAYDALRVSIVATELPHCAGPAPVARAEPAGAPAALPLIEPLAAAPTLGPVAGGAAPADDFAAPPVVRDTPAPLRITAPGSVSAVEARIHARGPSASLADRLYFLGKRWARRSRVALPPPTERPTRTARVVRPATFNEEPRP